MYLQHCTNSLTSRYSKHFGCVWLFFCSSYGHHYFKMYHHLEGLCHYFSLHNEKTWTVSQWSFFFLTETIQKMRHNKRVVMNFCGTSPNETSETFLRQQCQVSSKRKSDFGWQFLNSVVLRETTNTGMDSTVQKRMKTHRRGHEVLVLARLMFLEGHLCLQARDVWNENMWKSYQHGPTRFHLEPIFFFCFFCFQKIRRVCPLLHRTHERKVRKGFVLVTIYICFEKKTTISDGTLKQRP